VTRRGRDGSTLDITNAKVASLVPTWRRYHGVSVLFDNPGTRPPRGVVPLVDIPVINPQLQRLYDGLARAVTNLDEAWRNRHGLCLLPRHSYHVTVCDGPNQHSRVSCVSALLEGLPTSLDRLPRCLAVMTGARVLAVVPDNPVTLAVSEIVVWGHVLAARLLSVDSNSEGALDRIAAARVELTDDLWTELRLRTQWWRPHVSLGYFPNRDAASAAGEALPPACLGLPAALDTSITFASAAVYGFTDMASFFRVDPDDAPARSHGPGTGR
jgi:hypothetical protein